MAFDFKTSLLGKTLIKNKILLIGALIAIIAVWYGYNEIYKNSIVSMQQTKSDIDNENINMNIAEKIANFQSELETYRGYFVKETDMPWLIDKVSKAADEAGLKIVSLNSRPSGAVAPLLYNSISLAASGTFNQLGDFVSIIENSREFTRVERMSFKKNEQLLNADIVIAAYFWK